MSRTKGTYTLTSNIEPKVGAPLDARTIVKLLADLTASNTFEYPYKGMKVFVEENNKSYTLVGSDPTVSTNWVEDNSGGHTIKNSAGTAMTQRSNLQFVDLTVSDDSTNDVTKVENIHVIQSESELDNLPDGLYMLDDDEGTVIDGNEVGYDNTNSGLASRNIQDAIDELAQGLPNIPAIYSFEEHEVGVWTDGKPLYQKTYDLGSSGMAVPAGGFVDSTVPVDDIETIVAVASACDLNAVGTICWSGIAAYIPYNHVGYVRLQSDRNGNSSTIRYLTLQYTKTTDTPGSGKWTPSGIPAKHYSTTEQVIGTWIDGKPLYEKTINVQYSDLSTYGFFKGIPLQDTNEKIRNVISACAISSSYGNCFLGCTLYGKLNDRSYYFALNMYYTILVVEVSGYSWEQIAPDICATIQYTKTTD